jgi:hypothetical protein
MTLLHPPSSHCPLLSSPLNFHLAPTPPRVTLTGNHLYSARGREEDNKAIQNNVTKTQGTAFCVRASVWVSLLPRVSLRSGTRKNNSKTTTRGIVITVPLFCASVFVLKGRKKELAAANTRSEVVYYCFCCYRGVPRPLWVALSVPTPSEIFLSFFFWIRISIAERAQGRTKTQLPPPCSAQREKKKKIAGWTANGELPPKQTNKLAQTPDKKTTRGVLE